MYLGCPSGEEGRLLLPGPAGEGQDPGDGDLAVGGAHRQVHQVVHHRQVRIHSLVGAAVR